MEGVRNAIVLGAGWIGAETARQLAQGGAQVLAVTQSRVTKMLQMAKEEHPRNIRIIHADLREKDEVRRILHSVENPDIYQFAARAFGSAHTGSDNSQAEPMQDFEGNAKINKNVAAVVKTLPIRSLSFSSSYFVYQALRILGKIRDGKVFEETDLDPHQFYPIELLDLKKRQPYLWEKIVAERRYQLLAKNGVRVHTFRFGNVYGSGQRHMPQYPHLVPHFYNQNQGKTHGKFTIFGDGTQTRAWIHVRDIVDGILASSLSERTESTLHNLGGTQECDAHTIAEVVGDMSDGMKITTDINYDPTKPGGQSLLLSSEKAKKELGWTPQILLRKGLIEAMKFYREHGLGN